MGFIIIAIGLFELISIAAGFLYICILYIINVYLFYVFIIIYRKKEENNEIIFFDNITSIKYFFK